MNEEESALRKLENAVTQLKRKARPSKDDLNKWLTHAAKALSQLEQPSSSNAAKRREATKKLETAIKPLCEFIINNQLLKLSEEKRNEEVKLRVAVCVSEVLRVLAPEPPLEDEHLQDVFKLIVGVFRKLGDTTCANFLSRAKILGTIARCKCCIIMLDIDCNGLMLDMFNVLFSVVSEHHHQSLINDILSIMTTILSEEVSESLVDVILRNLVKEEKGASAASQLASSVIQTCANKLDPYVCQFLSSCIMDRDTMDSDLKEFYHEIIFKISLCAPQLLLAIIPTLTQELLADQVDVRIKAVTLAGKLFSLPEHRVTQNYHHLFSEFLKRFSDKSAEVRKKALQCAEACYMASPSGVESQELISTLEDRLLDFDDGVRIEAVTVACELARCNLKFVPPRLISLASERLRDKKMLVRKRALQNLIDLYRQYCAKCSEGCMTICDHFEQIPSKMLMLCYDKDCKEFRPQNMEIVLAEDLFPVNLSVQERTKHWIHLFSLFTPLHVKSLKSILSQKRRLQTDMHTYLALRRNEMEMDQEEIQKRIKTLFMRMSASFSEPSKAEEGFYKLNDMKDNNIFKSLFFLLEEVTITNAHTARDRFLKLVGDRHPLFDFLQLLSAKCMFNIFCLEHVHCVLDSLASNFFANKHTETCTVELLQVIVSNFPLLLKGSEEQFKSLFVESESVRNKLIEVLAKAGQYLSVELSDFYPILERVCLEGNRHESKIAVEAVAALTNSSEEFVFSDLCKAFVDSLHRGQNIPTVLQGLGCIAQYSTSAFEAQERKIASYIYEKILHGEPSDDLSSYDKNSGCCKSCKLKIFGIKTLVKSFLPHRGAQVRRQINKLLDILTKMLQNSSIFETVVSCECDKTQVKLAAGKSIIQLSKRWDLHISPETFRYTVLIAKDPSSLVRRLFLNKLHKLMKDRTIPCKYACAFAFASLDLHDSQLDSRKYMAEFIKDYSRDGGIQKTSMHVEPVKDSAAYILVFLIHILAHDRDFPSQDCRDEKTYARFCSPLYFILQSFTDASNVGGDMNIVKNAILYVFSIFRALKKAEDAVDAQKTHRLQVLSDIGIEILTSLSNSSISVSNAPGVILLPSSLYRISNDNGDKASSTYSTDGSFIKRVVQVLRSHLSTTAIDCGIPFKSRQEAVSLSKTVQAQRGKRQETSTGQRRKRAISPTPIEDNRLQKDCSTVNKCKNLKSKNREQVLEKEQLSFCESVTTKPSSSESIDAAQHGKHVILEENIEKHGSVAAKNLDTRRNARREIMLGSDRSHILPGDPGARSSLHSSRLIEKMEGQQVSAEKSTSEVINMNEVNVKASL